MKTSPELRPFVLGCLLGSCSGPFAPDWLAELVEEGLAGVTAFAANGTTDVESGRNSYGRFVSQLRDRNPDVLVAIDEEGGDVTRIHVRRGSNVPSARALGVVDDLAGTLRAGSVLGAELRHEGINLNLAPCADLASLNSNVIGTRSFGASPGVVARHLAAYVSGLHAEGIAACAKHFPGHGITDVDSHETLPVSTVGIEVIMSDHVAPFSAAIEAGVDAIMLGHLLVPELTNLPTSQSPQIVEMLRVDLGFTGPIITDALDMGAVGSSHDLAPAAIASLSAGADLLCLGSNLDQAQHESVVAGIERAVVDGVLPVERLVRSSDRIRTLAIDRRLDMWSGSTGTAFQLDAEDQKTMVDLARRAFIVEGPVEVGVNETAMVCSITSSPVNTDQEWSVGEALAEAGVVNESFTVDGISDVDRVLDGARRPSLIVVNGLGRSSWQSEAVAAVRRLNPKALVVEVGATNETPAAPSIVTQGSARVSIDALAQTILDAAGVQHGNY